MSRRSFLRASTVLSAGVAAIAAGLAPLRKLGEFTLRRRVPPEILQGADAGGDEGGAGPDRGRGAAPVRDPAARARLQADERRRIRLRPQPHPLRRLPQVRPRLRRGEQPVPQPGDPVHPRAEDAERRHVRRGQGGPQLRAEVRAGAGLLLHAGPVPPVQEPALRQGLPGEGDLAGAGRHNGGRLQLVHRLPLLRGGLPVLRPALQFHRTVDPDASSSTSTCPTSATGRGTRA